MATQKKLVRQADGTLVEQEVSAPELNQGTSAPAPSVAPPVSPRGAAAQGANEHVAKMTGSSAQKQNALAETTKPTQDLAQIQRQVGTPTTPAPGATDTARQAKELAGSLSGLGSYGERVQGLIKARLDQVAQQSTAPTVNKSQVGTVLKGKTPEQIAAAEAALAAYAASGSEADLAKIRDAFGQQALDAGGLQALYEGATDGLGRAAGVAKGDITIGQLDLPDAPQIAADLGISPEALAAMSPDQFQQAVQDTLNRSLSQVDTLKAEYRTASPARRAQILEQLRAADASGLAAAEASAAHLAEELDRGESVKFAGQAYNIQELLKSDTVSDMIRRAAGNPAALAQLAATEPALADWVRRNTESLKAFTDTAETQRTALEATQAQAAELTKDLTPELKEALKFTGLEIPTGTLTAAQVAELEAAMGSNQLLAAIRSNPAVSAKLQADPELAERLKGMPASQIADLVRLSDEVFADPQLSRMLGVDASEGLLPGPRIADAMEMAKVWGQIPPAVKATAAFSEGLIRNTAGLEWAAYNADMLQREDVQSLIQDGSISTLSGLQFVANNPQVLTKLSADAATHDRVKELTANPEASVADMQTMLFGAPVDFETVDKMLGMASEEQANGNVKRGEIWAKGLLNAYDLNGDGQFTRADFTPERIASRLKGVAERMPTPAQILQGAVADPFAAERGKLAIPELDKLMAGAGVNLAADTARRLRYEEQRPLEEAARAEAKIAADAEAQRAADKAAADKAAVDAYVAEERRKAAALKQYHELQKKYPKKKKAGVK